MADLAKIAAEICPEDPLDLGIAWAVKVLRDGGVETFESCEGGGGHAFAYPVVRFVGTDAAGWHALSVAITQELPVRQLARVWFVANSRPEGPVWELRLSSSRPVDSWEESANRSDSLHRYGAGLGLPVEITDAEGHRLYARNLTLNDLGKLG